jgi:hypothetical protein
MLDLKHGCLGCAVQANIESKHPAPNRLLKSLHPLPLVTDVTCWMKPLKFPFSGSYKDSVSELIATQDGPAERREASKREPKVNLD